MGGIGFGELDSLRDWYRHAGHQQQARLTPEVIRRMLRSMVDVSQRDPLVRAYVARNGAPNTEGWHALGELRALGLTLALSGLNPGYPVDVELLVNGEGRALDREASAMALVGRTLLAQPYLWMDAIDAHVRSSPDLPRHTIARDQMPFPMMFWSLQTSRVSQGVECNWFLLSDEAGCLSIMSDYTVPPGVPDPISGEVHPLGYTRFARVTIDYGSVWPDDYAGVNESVHLAVEWVLKSIAFLASPYVVAPSATVPRAFRREAARLAKKAGQPPPPDPLVRVVTLREPATPRPENDDPDWQGARRHHWWVAGHYRAQWYPSLKGHKVIWIAPHLQGDLSKPLLERVYKVAR